MTRLRPGSRHGPVGCTTPNHDPITTYVHAHTPRVMPAQRWALAAEPVRAAVLAAQPPHKANASQYLGVLVSFLSGPCGWNGTSTPELVSLLAAAWRHQSGGTFTAEPLKPVVAALKAAGALPAVQGNAPGQDGGPVQVSGPWWALTEVTNQPLGSDVTSNAESGKSTGSVRRRPATTATTGTAAVRPMSRRAALAHARAARAAREAQGKVTEPGPVAASREISDAVDSYRPELKYRAAWEANREVGQRLVLGYRPTTPRNARNVCSHVVVFLNWYAVQPGRDAEKPITLDELVAPGLIERFIASRTGSDRSTASLRSTMRRAIGSLNPDAHRRSCSTTSPHRRTVPPNAPRSSATP